MADVEVGSGTHTPNSGSPHPDRIPLIVRNDAVDRLSRPNSRNQSPTTPVVDEPPREDVAKELGILFHQIIEEATNFSVLKIQKDAAQKEFDKREADFKKSEPIHERFPATEETQKRSKDRAEKALKAISEKVEQKDSSLKELAKRSAARIAPHIVASRGKPDAQSRVEELEKKCQVLQEQLGNQAKLIENLRKSHEERYKSLEDNYVKARKDWGYTKSAQANFERDCRPQLADALNGLTTTETDIKVLKAQLITQVPKDLKQKLEKLNGLSERVDKFPNLRLDVDKLKQESSKIAKDLEKLSLEQTKLREELVQLKAIEANMTKFPAKGVSFKEGSNSPVLESRREVENQLPNVSTADGRSRVLEPPTTSTPSSLVGIEPNLLAKIKSHVEATATLKKSITEHHESVSRDILEIKQTIKSIEKREIDTRAPQRLTDLERRLSSTTTPTPSMSMAASGVDFDTIKNEILEVVEEKQAAMDDVVQSISSQWQTAIKDSQIRCTNLEQRCSDIKALYDSLAALPNKLETFQKSLNITIRQQQTDIDDTKLNMAGKVADLLRAKPELLPLAPIGDHVVKRFDDKLSKLAKSQQDLTQAVNERLEANTDGLISIDRRLNNINTKDMAVFIIAQMESTYPDVRNAQSALVELKTSLHRDESMIADLNTSLAALKSKVDTLETRVPQNDDDEKAIQSLRSEVDDLILQVPHIRNIANSAKETADTVNGNVATIQMDFNKFQTEIAEEVGKFRIDLEEMKDQQQAKATSAPPASVHLNKQSPIPPPIPPQRQSVILPPRSILNGNAARSSPKNSAPGTPQRHSSVQSDGTSKKRKLNGSSTNTPKGSNGVNGAKRKRKYRLDGDDSEDSTFEPNQPKISDDDED